MKSYKRMTRKELLDEINRLAYSGHSKKQLQDIALNLLNKKMSAVPWSLWQERPRTHMLTAKGIACNKNMGGASGWRYTYDPNRVTCRNCRKAMGTLPKHFQINMGG